MLVGKNCPRSDTPFATAENTSAVPRHQEAMRKFAAFSSAAQILKLRLHAYQGSDSRDGVVAALRSRRHARASLPFGLTRRSRAVPPATPSKPPRARHTPERTPR